MESVVALMSSKGGTGTGTGTGTGASARGREASLNEVSLNEKAEAVDKTEVADADEFVRKRMSKFAVNTENDPNDAKKSFKRIIVFPSFV